MIQNTVQIIVVVLIAITWHELAHGLTATALGDDTPRREGHLSLNPFRHMDQFGIIILFLSALAQVGFAYGFTPVNERNLRPNPKLGGGIVAVIGPLSNFILALVSLGIFVVLRHQPAISTFVLNLVFDSISINVFLGLFNLIPLPPLDGWRVLETFLSPRTLFELRKFKEAGPMILIAVILLNNMIHILAPLYALQEAIVTALLGFVGLA